MKVYALKNETGVPDSLSHIHFETPSYGKKRMLEESLQEKEFQILLKRIFDIFTSLILIICFLPVLTLIAILIKFTSRGSLLYSNERVGYKGKNFRCYKFRSMITDQRIKKADYEIALARQEQGILHKVKDDDRITWIGKIIRKASVDELPQLFNVLKGDMSIIGPRPLVPFMLKNMQEFQEIRSLMRPGITGLWQIRDRANNTSAEYMVEHDTEYVEEYSFLLDAKILLKTPLVVIRGEGAY